MLCYRYAAPRDWPQIANLLSSCNLPLDGARDLVSAFLLACQGEELVACGALERFGDSALLRSVAVVEAERGSGLGQDLVHRLLDQAYEEKLRQVILLTTTADRFFPRFGFLPVTRGEVPEAVRESAEFQGACPSSSIVMRLDLSRRPTWVRLATAEDAEAIADIYNQGIADQTTFETELRTPEERREWMAQHGPRHPVLVAVRGEQVVGWASLNPFSARQAYRFVADLSVYVERSQRGSRVGAALMAELLRRAVALAYHKLVLTTFPHSHAAVRLYQHFGFELVGDYREQGLLNGVWTDTRLMERLL